MKMLEGRSEDWDLHLNGTALSLNVHRSSLHGMMPFVVMFHRLPNESKDDYTGDKPVLHEKEIDVKAFKEKLDLIDRIIVPATRDQIMKTQDKDDLVNTLENDIESWRILVLTNSFLARDIPTQQIKLISTSDTRDDPFNAYVVEAIINHKGSAPNYKYLVKWKGYSDDWNSWKPPSMFDSPDVVKQYWAQVNANSANSKGKAPKALTNRQIATRETKSKNKRARLLAKDDV